MKLHFHFSQIFTFVMCCAIFHHFHNLKIHEKHLWRGANFRACNFIKSSTPAWVFFTFSKLCKWYQIAQHISFGLHKKTCKDTSHFQKITRSCCVFVRILARIIVWRFLYLKFMIQTGLNFHNLSCICGFSIAICDEKKKKNQRQSMLKGIPGPTNCFSAFFDLNYGYSSDLLSSRSL